MRCCVPCCKNDTKNTVESKGLTFHRFPKKPHLRDSWMEVLGIIGWDLDESSAVCSEHFQKDAFYETKRGTRQVRSDAVPVPDIEISSTLLTKQVKLEPDFVEVDIDNVTIKQEALFDDEMADDIKPICATPPLTDNMNTNKNIKQEIDEEETEWSIETIHIKQEIPDEDEITVNNLQANGAEVRDPIGDPIAEQDIVSKESLGTSESKEKPKKVRRRKKVTKNAEKVAEKRFCCRLCMYRCRYKSGLLKHFRTHTGEKLFACDNCNYRSAVKSSLVTHMKIHTGEKPFACELCEYRCIRKGGLVIHMRTHTGEKPYACTICEFRCKEHAKLSMHIKTHTGEKPYGCEVCDYRCITKKYLTAHMRTHTGEKPFACQACDYRSKQKAHLNTHIKKHHTREK